MPFLAPVVPYIGAGLSALGGIFGKKAGKALPPGVEGPTQPATGLGGIGNVLGKALPIGGSILSAILGNRQTGTEKTAQGLLQGNAARASSLGDTLTAQGGQALDAAVPFWTRLLSGDRGVAMSTLGPEIRDINDRYDRTFQATRELYPRGGGTTAMASALPFEKSRAITSLFQTLRPEAASQMATVGTNLMALGLQGYNPAASMSLLDYGQKNRAMSILQGRDIGAALSSILFGGEKK